MEVKLQPKYRTHSYSFEETVKTNGPEGAKYMQIVLKGWSMEFSGVKQPKIYHYAQALVLAASINLLKPTGYVMYQQV